MDLVSGYIRAERRQSQLRITLSSSQNNNSLCREMLRDLLMAFESSKGARLIVLVAEGTHFCSGMNIEDAGEFEAIDPDIFKLFSNVLLKIYESEVPVIACVEGKVTGGGVGVVAACDIVLAHQGASFSLPEAIWGLTPALILPFLSNRVKSGKLNYLVQSCRSISTSEAVEIGLVDENAHDDLNRSLQSHVKRVLRASPVALNQAKKLIRDQVYDPRPAIQEAISYQSDWFEQAGNLEGLRSYQHGDLPSWFSKNKTWSLHNVN